MARVNVEQQALTDSRYVTLGHLIGADRHAALGRMVLVWNECQERGKRVLSRETVNNTNPDISDFSSAVEKSELARDKNGDLYICGSKGRVEWLSKARKNGKLGGRPKKNQTVPDKQPRGSSKKNPPAPAPPPSLAPTPPSESRERETATRGREGETALGNGGMSDAAFTARAKEIAAWCKKRKPSSEASFEADFEADFEMTWPYWQALKERMEKR